LVAEDTLKGTVNTKDKQGKRAMWCEGAVRIELKVRLCNGSVNLCIDRYEVSTPLDSSLQGDSSLFHPLEAER
jgi:hypothetical protein